ncbi:MAG: PAS domain-containing protein [Proteobacteria bacterium]|nr:PAS domain-containing protein [Pseudomonadota bacterium]
MAADLSEVAMLRSRVAELDAELARRADELKPLAAREALLAEAEGVVHLGSWVWDVPSSRIAWSDELYRILGHAPGSVEPSIDLFFAAIHADDRAGVRESSMRMATDPDPDTRVVRVVHGDGTELVVQLDGTVVRDDEGNVLRIVGTMHDITEATAREQQLVQSAEALRNAYSLGKMGYWTWDASTEHMEWSEELKELLGVALDHPSSVKGFLEMVPKAERSTIRDFKEQAVATGEAQVVSHRIERPSGGEIHVVMITEAKYEDGELDRLHGTVMDVTERVLLERRFLQAQKMDALGRLAGGVAHDFNNLLTVILGNAGLLARFSPSSEVNEIIQAGETAANLSSQLLAFSRHSPLNTEWIDVNAVADKTAALLRRVAGVDVDVRLELSAERCGILGDQTQLDQVLLNLVVNARDAMPEGGTVRIRTAVVDDEVLIEVTDQGVGIDSETLEHVFDPFFTTKPAGVGTGLGLSTVLGIVKRFGGQAGIESTVGLGTKVRLCFPWVAGESPSPSVRQSTRAAAQGSVLVVDDDPGVLRILCRFLEDAGYSVTSADSITDGRAAFAGQGPFRLLVTDLLLPDGNGAQLAADLLAEQPELKVVYVTGYAPRFDDAPIQNGALVEKPFQRQELLDTVDRVLNGSS